MPFVKPFGGLLYADTRPDAWARVLAPPFDMIGGEEQQALFAADAHNIAWLTVADDGPGYPGVASRLAQWREGGVLKADPQPAFYAYEQTVGEARLRGFLGAVRLQNPPEAAVYPHENTFAQPIVDRLALMTAARCSLEPVFGIYTDASGQAADALREAIRQDPLCRAQTPDGAVHRLWRITDAGQQDALSGIVSTAKVVIADGHHRWAAAGAYRDEMRASGATDPDAPHEFALMLLVEEMSGGVECGAFHRVIQRLPDGVDPARLEPLLGPHFAVEEFATEGLSDEEAARAIIARVADEPSRPVFGCRWRTGAAIVRLRDLDGLLAIASREIDPIVQDFDVALLHRLVLKPRLGCRGDYGPQACAVLFEKDPVTAWRRVSSSHAVMAWFVNPAPISSVMRAAFAGLTVPQKATHFYPKPPSGMVVYELSARE